MINIQSRLTPCASFVLSFWNNFDFCFACRLLQRQFKMRLKRHQKAERNIGFYCVNFGFRKPFQILVDGTFCMASAQVSSTIMRSLNSTYLTVIGTIVAYLLRFTLTVWTLTLTEQGAVTWRHTKIFGWWCEAINHTVCGTRNRSSR